MISKKLLILIIFIITASMLTSCASAVDFSETEVKHTFHPTNFKFEYSDGNTTQYHGDTGLRGAYCTNTIDGLTYFVPVENVRGIAKATHKTFKFDEDIDITHSLASKRENYAYIMLKMYYKNGTEIRSLDESDDDLTMEERSYFDNYDQQRQDYLTKQANDELDAIENNQEAEIRSMEKPRSGYYYGTNGFGYYYNSPRNYFY